MPSQVEAILIQDALAADTRLSYMPISLRARCMVASLSKDRRASTSVEIRPGNDCRISRSTSTAKRSQQLASCSRVGTALGRCRALAASSSPA